MPPGSGRPLHPGWSFRSEAIRWSPGSVPLHRTFASGWKDDPSEANRTQ
ncbi:MAG: hypothetical protein LBQ54_12575 [Planctomycetaceae bacterium]|nr:hypothetical protein [Planctomycetaceae bacterium]